LRVNDKGEHKAETRPDDDPTHSKSEKGSIVNAVGIGAASSAVLGSDKSWSGVYVVMVSGETVGV
jgi:hypothetical protein